MTGPDPRHDPVELSALALGLLPPEQAAAARQHVTGCAMCRREFEELKEMTGVLGELPPEAVLDGPPDGDLVLQRTLRQIRAETGAHRRRRLLGLVAAAAVVVAAVAGGGVAIGRASVPLVPPPGSAVGALVLTGTGAGGTALRATLGAAGSLWWPATGRRRQRGRGWCRARPAGRSMGRPRSRCPTWPQSSCRTRRGMSSCGPPYEARMRLSAPPQRRAATLGADRR